MNYAEWFERFLDDIARWSKIGSLTLQESRVEPPRKKSEIVKLFSAFSHPPADILDFYSTASSSCVIRFNTCIKKKAQGRSGSALTLPNTVGGGLTLVRPDLMRQLSEEMHQLLSFSSERQKGASRKFMQHAINSTIPLCKTKGGDYLAFVSENPALQNGIYLFLLESFGRPDGVIPLCRSFEQYLQLLENRCYIGSDWNTIQLWYRDGELRKSDVLYEDIAKQLSGKRTSVNYEAAKAELDIHGGIALRDFRLSSIPKRFAGYSQVKSNRCRLPLDASIFKGWQVRSIRFWFESRREQQTAQLAIQEWLEGEQKRLKANLVLVTCPNVS
jgi:hypothetical protein